MSASPPQGSSPAWSPNDLARDPHAAADKADRVRSMFAAIAGRYDLNNRLHSFGRDQSWRRRAVKAATVRPTDRVLDVACGTGDLTEAFAAAGPAEVVGIDFTAPMLEVARRKRAAARGRRAAVPVTYLEGDATALDVPDDAFDVVSIAFGIRNVSDPARALAEFHRVLRPGGRLVVLEFGEPRSRVLRSLSNFYTHHVMPRTASLIAGDRSGAYRYLPRSIDTFLDADALARCMLETGFVSVSQHPLTFGICTLTVARRGTAGGRTGDPAQRGG